ELINCGKCKVLILLSYVDRRPVQVGGQVEFFYRKSAFAIIEKGFLKFLQLFRNLINAATYLIEFSFSLYDINGTVKRSILFHAFYLRRNLGEKLFSVIS